MKCFPRAFFALLAAAMLAPLTAQAAESAPPAPQPLGDLGRVRLADDDAVALQGLHQWLLARGMDASIKGGTVVYQRGLLLNITPLMSNGEIDRLLFRVYYNPVDKYRDKPEFQEMAAGINAAQNALQAFVDTDGDLAVGGSLTFVDVLEAREFDYYASFFVDLVREYVLQEKVVEMLK